MSSGATPLALFARSVLRSRIQLAVLATCTVVPVVAIAVAFPAEATDILRELYALLVAYVFAFEVAGLVALGIVTLLNDRLHRVDRQLKRASDKDYWTASALPLAVISLTGVLAGLRIYETDEFLGLVTIISSVGVVFAAAYERLKARRPKGWRRHHYLSQLFGTWLALSPHESDVRTQREMIRTLARVEKASLRLERMTRARSVWAEVDRRSPWLIAACVVFALIGSVGIITGLVTHYPYDRATGSFWLATAVHLVYEALFPVVFLLWSRLERRGSVDTLRDLSSQAGRLLRRHDIEPRSESAIRIGFSVDAEGYSKRLVPQMETAQDRIAALVGLVLADLGLGLHHTDHQNTGDGMNVFLPPHLEPKRVLPLLLNSWKTRLTLDNRQPGDRLRLRVAVSIGPVSTTELGFGGRTIIEQSRMLDSPALRQALTDHPEIDLAVLVSAELYKWVVGEGHPGLVPAQFRQIRVTAKEFDAMAWLWVTA
ncbi:hypothetical protein F4553_001548 [Allocatelliglobosispora scoriae]|uniref:Guanylate cyclase domain-containing protein n=1 Tax=Allocatelliglobosispora scoriae TaxID=643052 RepID=A0A841BLU9_9ACTN|nr:hypothetical protein [Allocatelliglobosispora scoriae]MBB5868169.1 hypothetical protein [Allocatelliglobosispora scoriae]